jgi:hypothetical protein
VLQRIIMAVVVLFAAGYVIWTFMPLHRRQRLLDLLATRGILVGAAARHRARLATPGCAHCSAATRTLQHPASPRGK